MIYVFETYNEFKQYLKEFSMGSQKKPEVIISTTKRKAGRPKKIVEVTPIKSLQHFQKSADPTLKHSSKKRNGGRGPQKYIYAKYEKFISESGAIERAKDINGLVYATRSTIIPETILYFVVPYSKSQNLNYAKSSMRKDFTDFYSNHIGEMTQKIQTHISSKCIYK